MQPFIETAFILVKFKEKSIRFFVNHTETPIFRLYATEMENEIKIIKIFTKKLISIVYFITHKLVEAERNQ